jgi:hypothetical protein
MAIKELFYDNRPQVLLDPRASQRIDPRFKFTRDSAGTYIDRDGVLRAASANQPRFQYDYETGEYCGLLLEPQSTNIITHSQNIADNSWDKTVLLSWASDVIDAPDGTRTADQITFKNDSTNSYIVKAFGITGGLVYSASCWAKGNQGQRARIYIEGTGGGAYAYKAADFTLTGEWQKVALTMQTNTGNGVGTLVLQSNVSGLNATSLYVWGFQYENQPAATNYIYTTTATSTRAADLLSIEAPLPSSGSVYIDARAITAAQNDTLLSLKNSSNDKIDLAYLSNTSTYNSLALIANYDGTSKTSLPLPVPTTTRERNIITWGANNYQYTRDSSRFAASLSSSVPTGLNQLSIGHDAVDPTKAFNGYINTVYAWSGELTPAVAEALVRNDLDPINADTYSPVGPAGSLALVINTQGATTGGNKTFTLPAESAANDNDIVITWGDGTESALELVAAEVGAAGLTHTYPSAGIYPVWVEGKMQNIYFNNIANAPDLLQIAAWGTNANGNSVFRTPSTMANAFYGCTQMNFSTSARTTNLPDTSGVTNWYRAFRNCSSITGAFPAFNFGAATTLQEAWFGCSGMTSFTEAGNQTQNVTVFAEAWRGCSALTSFPLINTSSGTTFFATWFGCSSLTSFPLVNTSLAANLQSAWQDCASLTSFPSINTSSCTIFYATWYGCSSLTSFPLLNTSAGTTFTFAWYNCSSLTSFPLIDTSSGVSFDSAWRSCSGLTSFPLLDTSSGVNFQSAWETCSSLTSFPLLDTSSGTNFQAAWIGCNSLTSFPAINTAASTNFAFAWYGCSSLASFPLLNTAAGTNFYGAWYGCQALTDFPALVFDSSVTGSATDLPTIASGFVSTWKNCTSLTTFPAGRFNSVTNCNRFLEAWTGCALTAASIENILVSINAAGTSNGNLGINGGTNAAKSTWTSAANTAYAALVARGWTIIYNA